jgi:two-component system, chemotaxis family, chemotaxis protein CheY
MSLDKSFLVVDDSGTMRQLITMTLKKMGCKSISDAPNGRVGLEKLEGGLPDVVLTDIDMPEMNGLEFIELARQKYATLPIVILSTHGDDATRDKGLILGANDYLTKPLSGTKLMDVLEKLFPDLDL